MKKLLLSIVLISAGVAGFGATVTIVNSGFTFSPNAVTINLGDDVTFTLPSFHNAQEVSLETWTANGTTALPGGFSVPFGGGNVPASELTEGIHYYVCMAHAASGMKGKITVVNTTGIAANPQENEISVYPNPSNGNFQLKMSNRVAGKEYELALYNILGTKVYSKTNVQSQNPNNIDLADLPKGTYFLRIFNGRDSYNRKIIVR
jgi:plastocyanin